MTPKEPNAARWATIVAELDTVVGGPSSTLKPAARVGSLSEAAVVAFGDALDQAEGRIEVHEVLGQGGMGVVHRATQVRLRRDVAVKSVRPERVTPERRIELLQEAWVTGALEHPNILPVYGIEVGPGREPAVLLKRLGNTRWVDLMHDADAVRSRLGRDDLLEWNLQVFMQVCQAVHFAHSRRILHLDLKPENVMIGEFGEVYLVDWGIAMSLEDDGTGRFRIAAKSDQIIGTPAFLAPEMLAGDGSLLTERTDVYLLGACLFFLTEGRPVRAGDSLMEVLHAAIMSDAPAATKAAPELADVIDKALSRDPTARHASADELRRAVADFIGHRDSRTRSAEAMLALDGLRKSAQRSEHGTGASTHAEVQQAFNECRIGFQGALRQWPDNPEAKRGLEDALEVVARYEIGRDDCETAAAHIEQIESPSADLLAALEAGRELLKRRRSRAAALEQLEADRDLATGQRTRTFLVTALALCWAIVPLVRTLIDPSPTTFVTMLVLPTGYLVLMGGFAVWARDSLGKTAINRFLVASLAVALIGQIFVTLSLYVMGYGPAAVLPMSFCVWGAVAWMVVLNGERRLWPTGVAITGFGVASALTPDNAMFFVSAASLALLANVVVVWWPWSEAAKRAREARAAELADD